MVDERGIAEAALASLTGETESQSIRWPSVASRVKAARELCGISQAELAARLGMTPSEYMDIEFHDDEAFLVFTLSNLELLSAHLGVALEELLFGSKVDPGVGRTSYADVAARLSTLLVEQGVTVEALSDRVGWELAPVLGDPSALGQFSVDGLRDVCQAVGVDWVSALPRPK